LRGRLTNHRLGCDTSDKAVATLGNGSDVLLPVGSLAKDFSQKRNVLCEGVLSDKRVRPEKIQEFIFGNKVIRLLYQQGQGIEELRRKGSLLTLKKKAPFLELKAEIVKFKGLGHERTILGNCD